LLNKKMCDGYPFSQKRSLREIIRTDVSDAEVGGLKNDDTIEVRWKVTIHTPGENNRYGQVKRQQQTS